MTMDPDKGKIIKLPPEKVPQNTRAWIAKKDKRVHKDAERRRWGK
jgi:hypothetical protein